MATRAWIKTPVSIHLYKPSRAEILNCSVRNTLIACSLPCGYVNSFFQPRLVPPYCTEQLLQDYEAMCTETSDKCTETAKKFYIFFVFAVGTLFTSTFTSFYNSEIQRQRKESVEYI